jgi:outer membrane protein TolC
MVTFYKRKCKWLLSLVLLIPTLSVFAQQKNTLADLIASADNHLPVLLQKKELVNASKAEVTDIRHSFLPQLQLSEQVNIGTDNSMAGSYFPFGIVPSTSAGVNASNNMNTVSGNVAVLYGQYDLVNFGLNGAKIKNAKAYVGLQEADLQKEQYYVELNIAKLYFNVLKSQYILNVDKENVDRYQSIFTIIQALTSSGIKAGSDSSLAKAELSKTRITYNQTLGNISQLKQQLSYFTGIPVDQLNIDTTNNSFTNVNIDSIHFATDSINNPLIDYYAKKKNIYLANDKLIRRSYLPKISLAASTWARGSSIEYNNDYQSLDNGLGYQRYNYLVGLNLTYNLFNGLYRKDKLNINNYELKASDDELQQQKLALTSASLQADDALQSTRANLLELPIQLQSAEDTYQQKVAQYKAGLISLIDLTNASFVLYRSQTDYIETMSDWYLAQLDKAAATGTLTQFIQTIK